MSQILNLKKLLNTKKKGEQGRPKIQIKSKKVFHDIKWQASEFERYPKNKAWFNITGLIALIFLVLAIILKNYFLIFLIALSVFLIYLYGLKHPRKIKFSISGQGIMIRETLHSYQELESFWIFYEPPEIKEVSVKSKKTFSPYLKIPLGNQNPVKVRQALLKFLPEEQQEESLIDLLARKLRF